MPSNPASSEDAQKASNHRDRAIALAFVGGVLAKCFAGFVTLITVPMAIDALGAEIYGLWIAITAFFTMFRFLDGGVVYAMINITASCVAQNENDRLRRMLTTAYVIAISLSMVGIAVAVPLCFATDWRWLLGIDGVVSSRVMQQVAILACVLFFVSIPLGIAEKVLRGLQRTHWMSLVSIAANSVALTAVAVGWWYRLDLLWFLIAFAIGPLLAHSFATALLWGCEPQIFRGGAWSVAWKDVYEILRVGILFWGIQLSMSLAFEIDALMVSHFVGLKGVAELGVVNQMFLVALTLTGLLAAPLWPAFRDAVIRKDRGWIDRTLSRSIQISFGISLSVTIPILLFGGWVGEWMAAKQFVPTFSVLFAVFVWTNVQAVNGVLAMLLNGLQVIRLQLALSFLMTVVNLVLSLVLVQWIGVSGVIWGSIIANICCMLIPYWLLLPRIIDKHMGEKPLGD